MKGITVIIANIKPKLLSRLKKRKTNGKKKEKKQKS